MTTSTTGLRPPPGSEVSPATTGKHPEPQILLREARSPAAGPRPGGPARQKTRPRIHGTHTSSDQTADAEYARARQGLTEKLERLNREAVAEDEKQRCAIVTAAIDGEAKAKAEFAAGSRKIATMFDAARDSVKSEYGTGKAEVARTHDSSQKKAARKNAEKTKPIEDSAGLADSIRNRLAALAADYTKFKLDPEPPAAVSESYEKFDDPGDELFTRLTRMDQPLRRPRRAVDPQVDERRPRGVGLHPADLHFRRAGHDD